MSILARILGRRPAPTLPPPPPQPPRGDLLTLNGPGLAGTDLSGEIELTITAGGRTYAAATTRRGPGEFALHDFREVVPEPEPEPVVVPEPEPEPVVVPEPESEPVVVVVPEPESEPVVAPEPAPVDPPFVAAVEESPAVPAAESPSVDEPVVAEEAPVVVAEAPAVLVEEPATDSDEIAVVRLPLTDLQRHIVGYELAVDGRREGAKATAALLLDAFGDVGLERLAGRHAAWVAMTSEFLLEVGTPPVRPDRVVLQLPAEQPSEGVLSALQRLQFSGYTIALDGYHPELAAVARYVRVPVAGRTDEELRPAIAEPIARGLELVATGVATHEELERCTALGFTIFQGEFFGRPDPMRQRRVGTGGIASVAALAAVARPDAGFEDLEEAIGNDVGLSLKLLRYVNSAFFALPRTVETVREALTLLGTATVRRWATVMALVAAADDAPEELVELALQRARMCEVLGGNRAVDASDAHFTVGLFSVADTLLGSSMEDVLDTLPFSDEIRAALLRREGPKGELLNTVVAYEQGEFPTAVGPEVYSEAVEYAGDAVRAAP
jgi:EAL and modified HD-GYP domain-containing signal transduction protein